MRVALCVLVCLMAIGAVAASRVAEFDEAAVLAELGESPAQAASADLMSLSDLGAEEMALLEADASESDTAAQLLAMKDGPTAAPAAAPAPAAPAAAAAPAATAAPSAAPASQEVKKNGLVKGADYWTIAGGRAVYAAVDGAAIGYLPENAEVVVEYYQFAQKSANEKTQWAYGYVSKGGEFGGWAGANACGWFQLMRQRDDPAQVLQATMRSNLIKAAPKCPGFSSGALARTAVFKQGSFLESGPNDLTKAGTKSSCNAFLNYDPKSGLASGAVPAVEAGVFSGTGALGNVPTSVKQTRKVDGFGVLAVTKDGKFALVKHPNLAPTMPRAEVFFVNCDCIEFDAEAVKATNAAVKPATTGKISKGPTSASSQSEVDDSMLVELHTESHAELGLSNEGARGNYPGWSSMIELASEDVPAPAAQSGPAPVAAEQREQPAALEGATRAGPGAPVKNFPPAAANVRHVTLAAGETSAQLKSAQAGVSKIHVHVYGKSDSDDKERRLQGMVTRLANRQSKSYKKINKLLRKLKHCARSGQNGCLSNITNKLEDWKAEFVEKP